MDQLQWDQIYRESKRNGHPDPAPVPEPRKPPVPTGAIASGVTVIRPVVLSDEPTS